MFWVSGLPLVFLDDDLKFKWQNNCGWDVWDIDLLMALRLLYVPRIVVD
jgi:hypothetical protein